MTKKVENNQKEDNILKKLEVQKEAFHKFDKRLSGLSSLENQDFLKRYEDISREMEERLAPLKSTIEIASRTYSNYSNILAPVIRNIEPIIQNIENQMKVYSSIFEHRKSYYTEETIFPKCLYKKDTQSDATIAELRKLRKLVKKLLIPRDNKDFPKWFDHRNNSINFYGKIYKPRMASHAKFIFQLVIRHQRDNKNGVVLDKGEKISEKILSDKIGSSIKNLKGMRKEVNRVFRDKGFPLRIDSATDGIILIHTI